MSGSCCWSLFRTVAALLALMGWQEVFAESAQSRLVLPASALVDKSDSSNSDDVHGNDITPMPLGDVIALPNNPEALHNWQLNTRKVLSNALAWPIGREKAELDAAAPPALRPLREMLLDSGYWHQEFLMTLSSGRELPLVITRPPGNGPFPAVICLHGHSGHRHSVYSAASVYRGFAARLARRGYITLSLDIGDHRTPTDGRSLVAQRLDDVQRALDVLIGVSGVDPLRVGVAGLSLGGQVAMWLGAMDERIAAVVAAGWLGSYSVLDAEGHCPCWKVPGLSTHYDMAEIYALVAPRPLLCLLGTRDLEFPFAAGERSFLALKPAWRMLGATEAVEFGVHPGGHVFAPDLAEVFLARWLGGSVEPLPVPLDATTAIGSNDTEKELWWQMLAAGSMILSLLCVLWALRTNQRQRPNKES